MNDLRYRARGIRTVAVVDPNSIYVAGLRTVLTTSDSTNYKVWPDLACLTALEQAMSRSSTFPDLVLVDEGLLSAGQLSRYTRRWPDTKWVILATYPRRTMDAVSEYVSAGARAILPRSIEPDQLRKIVAQVLSGESLPSPNQLPPAPTPAEQVRGKLTSREMEILQLIAQGLRNHEIGKQLYISDQTVGVHRKNLMRKLSVNNSAALIGKSFRLRLIY